MDHILLKPIPHDCNLSKYTNVTESGEQGMLS